MQRAYVQYVELCVPSYKGYGLTDILLVTYGPMKLNYPNLSDGIDKRSSGSVFHNDIQALSLGSGGYYYVRDRRNEI